MKVWDKNGAKYFRSFRSFQDRFYLMAHVAKCTRELIKYIKLFENNNLVNEYSQKKNIFIFTALIVITYNIPKPSFKNDKLCLLRFFDTCKQKS